MKNQLGIVIKNDGNSAKVKVINNKKNTKIIKASNGEGAIVGEEVYIEFNKILMLKLMYIKFMQPIIFAILGLIVGNFIGEHLNQPNIVYKFVFICLFVTISIIYKDYTIEKNKISLKYSPTIKKVN